MGEVMRLYRIISKRELDLVFQEKSFRHVGSTYQTDLKNKHFYYPNIFYMHFFLNKTDTLYLLGSNKRYICTFEVPNELLKEEYLGIGRYLDLFFFQTMQDVREYAIPNYLISIDDLIQIEECDSIIDIEDLEDTSIEDYTTTIYTKEKGLTRVRD